MQSHEDDRRRIITRLSRVEGQLRGIKTMIENEATCEDVAHQMTAARRALDRAFYEMLACSLLTHVEGSTDTADIRASTEELARLLVKFA
ncbi:MAG TPA: metal-sensitive transcriptional regulator [Dokdonella sp.]|jgi:CsoR family transcriptional regulator, copper-sensing transcriptional repressor|nr:metal-sensitive transcriptional regulator [Dokdonella sp.]